MKQKLLDQGYKWLLTFGYCEVYGLGEHRVMVNPKTEIKVIEYGG